MLGSIPATCFVWWGTMPRDSEGLITGSEGAVDELEMDHVGSGVSEVVDGLLLFVLKVLCDLV